MRKSFSILGILASALTVVACGSSSSNSSSASASANPALELARCMRAHGVPDFPDPSSSGGGFQFKTQINPQSPSIHAAMQACQKYMPRKPHPGSMSPSQRAHAVVFARCMRSHGISNFPDPSVGSPSPNVNERILALRGMFFVAGPGLDPKSPAFRQAAAACGVKLPPPGDQQVPIG